MNNSASVYERATRRLETLFLVYVVLLVFEGCVRKWMLPQASDYVLIVRDPIAVLIYICGARRSGRRWAPWLRFTLFLAFLTGIVGFIQIIASGGGMTQLLTVIYGVRTYWLHIPLAALFAAIVRPPFLRRLCTVTIVCGAINLALMFLQYAAPGDAYINRGSGGAENVQIGVVGDIIRPAGTFTYATGPAYLFPIVLVIGLIGLCNPRYVTRSMAVTGVLSALIAIPISGSRTLLFLNCCVLCAGLPLMLTRERFVQQLILLVAVVAVAFAVVLKLDMAQAALASFSERWASAKDVEAGLDRGGNVVFNRVAEIMTGGYDALSTVPAVGLGVGLGTNVGAKLNAGYVDFLLAEYEWARIIMECGPFLGLLVIFWRFQTVGLLLGRVVALGPRSRKVGFAVCGAAVPYLVFGHIQQPTVLGMVTFALMLGFGVVECEVLDARMSRLHTAQTRDKGATCNVHGARGVAMPHS